MSQKSSTFAPAFDEKPYLGCLAGARHRGVEQW